MPQHFVAKLTVPGMGGIYNTVNLHLYHYAGIWQRSDSELQANNPVKYNDPDEKEIEDKPTFLSLIETLNFIKDNVKTKAEQTIFFCTQNGRIRFVDMNDEKS